MADAFDDETEQTITIDEYIKDVEAQELEADLVLGGDDGKECTYPKGHMKRQAIFSCLTCTPNGNAGVCTGCSLSCHDGHEIVELWTKRKFRCDCGNSKFGEFFCKLFADKETENSENSYNQNFKGFYCTCGHPYPDPDAEEQVEMIQCCICEDWFHENHLGLDPSEELPRDEEGEPLYEDFICQGCAFICSFLTLYPSSVLAPARQSDTPPIDNKENIVLETASSACASAEQLQNGIYSSKNPKIVCATTHVDSETRLNEKDPSLGESSDRNFGSKDDNSCSNNTVITPICALGVDLRVAPLDLEKKKPFFLSKNWRDLLCRCSTCGEFYSQKGIDYLIDKEDTIEEYEKMGKQRREEKLEQLEGAESSFLNNLGHIQKIEILSGIADMKNELKSFLESFDASKPVTSADVQQVFENLAKKKRQRQL